MAEELRIPHGVDKVEVYQSLLPQIRSLVEIESDGMANLCNMLAALNQSFDWLWVGLYFVKDSELVLGPFQGPVACTRIAFGKGVCGSSWKDQTTIIVPDVDAFPGHIACSTLSKSEIVVPIFRNGNVIAVLDVDSEHVGHFDEFDKQYLEELSELFEKFIS